MARKRPKYVQELPGYASINSTLDNSSHVIEGMACDIAKAMDDAILGSYRCHRGFQLDSQGENTP